jgi:hypothetical protein
VPAVFPPLVPVVLEVRPVALGLPPRHRR